MNSHNRLSVFVLGLISLSLTISACSKPAPTMTATVVSPTTHPAAPTAPTLGAPVPATMPSGAANWSRDERLYWQWVNYLASDELRGRGSGTPELDMARDFIVGQFKAMGLAPAVKEYTEPFEVRTGQKVQKQLVQLFKGDKPVALGLKEPAGVAMGFSGSGTVKGELVFIGYGIISRANKYDSFKDVPVDGLKDKIAVILRYEPQDAKGQSLWSPPGSWSGDASLMMKVMLAKMHGAVAVVLVNPPTHDDGLLPPGMAGGPATGLPVMQMTPQWFGQVLKQAGHEEKDALATLQARADKGPTIEALKGVSVSVDVKMVPQMAKVSNVLAVLPGSGTLANEVIVVGAHYDHVGAAGEGRETIRHGADDNASGTGGMLLLAKTYSQRARTLPGNRRTLVFAAFASEELGLLGSAYLTHHLQDLGYQASDVKAMVNLDMIGRVRNDKIQVMGPDSGQGLKEIVDKAAAASPLKVTAGGDGEGPSDQASFYHIKVPVLFLNSGMHADLHKPSDTIEKINIQGAVQSACLAEAMIDQLLVCPAPVYKAPQAGKRVALGVRLQEASDAQGAEIATVLGETPAERAGLKDGDIIIAWDGRAIADANALVAAIGQAKPGEQVTLKIVRGKVEHQIKVTFDK